MCFVKHGPRTTHGPELFNTTLGTIGCDGLLVGLPKKMGKVLEMMRLGVFFFLVAKDFWKLSLLVEKS